MVETLTPFVFPNSVHQSFDPSAPFAFGLAWDRQYPPNLSQVFSQEASLQARRWQVSRGPHQASVAREPTDRHPCYQWPTGERCWLSQGRPTGNGISTRLKHRQAGAVSVFSGLFFSPHQLPLGVNLGKQNRSKFPCRPPRGQLCWHPASASARVGEKGGGLNMGQGHPAWMLRIQGPCKGEGASEVFVLQQSSSMFYNRKTNIPTSPGPHSSHPYPALPGPHCSSTSESFPKIFF